jgi:hypothetical protein
MDTEERAGMTMKYVVEKLYENYLTNTKSNKSWYVFENPQNNTSIPSVDSQHGAMQKIQFWEPVIIKDVVVSSENPNRVDMELVFPAFSKFRTRFSNPKTAYTSYRLGKVIPLQLPDGTRWEHIMLKFLNGNDVRITLRNDLEFSHQASYNEMGFRNDKNRKPNFQWELLETLAKHEVYMDWESVQRLNDRKLINNIKKRKQLLSDTLKAYFQLNDDPFFDCNEVHGYQLKMTVLPEKATREPKQSHGDNFGLEDYYQEQTPSI